MRDPSGQCIKEYSLHRVVTSRRDSRIAGYDPEGLAFMVIGIAKYLKVTTIQNTSLHNYNP